jgi:hypothetical protein
VWCGNGSNAEEQNVALNIATTLANSYNGTDGRVVEVCGATSSGAWFRVCFIVVV